MGVEWWLVHKVGILYITIYLSRRQKKPTCSEFNRLFLKFDFKLGTSTRASKDQLSQKNILTQSARKRNLVLGASCCQMILVDFSFSHLAAVFIIFNSMQFQATALWRSANFYCPLALVERWQANAHSPCLEFISGYKIESWSQ